MNENPEAEKISAAAETKAWALERHVHTTRARAELIEAKYGGKGKGEGVKTRFEQSLVPLLLESRIARVPTSAFPLPLPLYPFPYFFNSGRRFRLRISRWR